MPSLSVTEPGVQVKLKHLEPMKETASFVVSFVDAEANPKVATLKHANGKTFNEMLRQKLNEDTPTGDMQGKRSRIPQKRCIVSYHVDSLQERS